MQALYDTDFNPCLKCNACTVQCPVSAVTNDFGGPKHLGPELARFTSQQDFILDPAIDLCTLCGTCDVTCPEGVHVAELTASLKAVKAETEGTKFRDFVLSHAEYVGKAASAFAPVTNTVMKIRPARIIMEKVMGMEADRQFPLYRFNHFKKQYKKKTADTERKVAYFAGCYTTYNNPDIGNALVDVFSANGIEVAMPDQKCCGVPMFANGQMKQGKKNANYNVKSLLSYVDEGYDIVMSCTSCSMAVKKEYLHYLDTPEAHRLSESVYDANEYLRQLMDNGEFNANLAPVGESAAYYAPCHMKGQSMGNPAMDVLEQIPDYLISDAGADCCGQCGTFGFKKEKYSYSMKMGGKMSEAITDLGRDQTVTECGMCKNQLDQLTDKETFHPLQILQKSYQTAGELAKANR